MCIAHCSAAISKLLFFLPCLPRTYMFPQARCHKQLCRSVQLQHAKPLPEAEQLEPNVVDVYTSDDEHFPVKKRLLRPCIALTSHVRAPDRAECHVDIDTPDI